MDVEYDSELEDILEVEFDGEQIRPYAFEPIRSSSNNERGESFEGNSDTESEGEMSQPSGEESRPVSEWCSCGNCQAMPTELENKCCQHTHLVDQQLEGLGCIKEHEGFLGNCLNIYVLQASFYEFIIANGALREGEQIHEVYRHIAYRRFTRWIYGLLGKRVRKVIPACAVLAIRKAFPSEVYAGFKYPQ